MAELKKLVQQREEEEARENFLDVTKQDDLNGFYRFMLNQRTADRKPADKPGDKADLSPEKRDTDVSQSVCTKNYTV